MHKPGNNHIQGKVANQINKHLCIILQQKVKDPRVGMVSINEVKLTRDNSVAKIYVTSISNGNHKEVAQVLNKMAGFLRTELASKIDMRSIPELRFYEDTVFEAGKKIDDLLDKIKKE